MRMTSKILHLEDDYDIQEITLMSLSLTDDFTLLQCSSGEEAIAAAADFQPDLLLLDVMMPGMSGPEVLVELRKLPGLEHTPAIFMTARVQPSEVRAFLDQGAVDVIAKPFDPITLGDRLTQVLTRSAKAA